MNAFPKGKRLYFNNAFSPVHPSVARCKQMNFPAFTYSKRLLTTFNFMLCIDKFYFFIRSHFTFGPRRWLQTKKMKKKTMWNAPDPIITWKNCSTNLFNFFFHCCWYPYRFEHFMGWGHLINVKMQQLLNCWITKLFPDLNRKMIRQPHGYRHQL